ncbi:MAG: hypothetical protein Q8P50_13245 [Bacillota bacterium]|nr:hypothetical protein [Bacillota bacterium]
MVLFDELHACPLDLIRENNVRQRLSRRYLIEKIWASSIADAQWLGRQLGGSCGLKVLRKLISQHMMLLGSLFGDKYLQDLPKVRRVSLGGRTNKT